MHDIDTLRSFLGWAALLNYAVLIAWFAAFTLAGDALYRLHARWFRIPRETFDALHYGGMAVYKIGVLLFFLVPWLVLRILG